jgi:dipeptidyl aminopeptidase/acylaminoacyl peptidase
LPWSPDGKWLAYTAKDSEDKGDCFLLPTNGGEVQKATVMSHPDFRSDFLVPLWDHSGQAIYCVGGDAVWKISVAEKAVYEISKISDHQIVAVLTRWGSGLAWSPDDGRSLYLSTRDQVTKQSGFYKVDLMLGNTIRLLEEDRYFGGIHTVFNVDVAADGQTIVFQAQDVQTSPDLWITDKDFHYPKRLTRINPQLERYDMGTSRLIEWKGIDGEPLRGALLLPAQYQQGRRYPLIVQVYGNLPLSNLVNQFGLGGTGVENRQLFATRGYAVLYPDSHLRVGTPLQDIAKSVMPGVDKVIELGIADPDRLGVMGTSYGGYNTLSLIVQTTRFKAAAITAGQGNLFSHYGQMAADGSTFGITWSELGQGRIGGTPWQFRDRYLENSPVFYMDRVQTPLLIMHGAQDSSVPSFLAEEIFVGLRRLGKEVVYAKYIGENHSVLYWGYANLSDYCNRMMTWFDQYLRPLN